MTVLTRDQMKEKYSQFVNELTAIFGEGAYYASDFDPDNPSGNSHPIGISNTGGLGSSSQNILPLEYQGCCNI